MSEGITPIWNSEWCCDYVVGLEVNLIPCRHPYFYYYFYV